MASKNYSKSKGRADAPGGFAGIPRIVMKHPDYIGLSFSAKAVLMEFAFQFRGKNNGDLTAAISVLEKRGMKSRTTVTKALDELLKAGMIAQTRQGRFTNPGGVCSLYALTWCPVDLCDGKLDVKPTTKPLRQFSLEKDSNNKTPRTESGQGGGAIGTESGQGEPLN